MIELLLSGGFFNGLWLAFSNYRDGKGALH